MKKFLTLKKNKKGFTLVELLVVLVILAILAAAIIPSMLGFIDKAKEEAASAECRNISLAANVYINEQYGKGNASYTTPNGTFNMLTGDANAETTILKIADVKTGADITEMSVIIATGKPTLAAAAYTASNKMKYTYTVAGGWVSTGGKGS